MKFKKALATLAAITAGSSAIFAQGLTASADEVVTDANGEAAYAAVVEDVAVEDTFVAPEVVTPAAEAEAVVVDETPVAVDVAVEDNAASELDAQIDAAAEAAANDEELTEETIDGVEAEKNATAINVDAIVKSDALLEYKDAASAQAALDAAKPAAEAGTNYSAIYSKYFYEKVLPYTSNGYANTHENANYDLELRDFTNGDATTGIRVYNEMLGVVGAAVYDFAKDGASELVVFTNVDAYVPVKSDVAGNSIGDMARDSASIPATRTVATIYKYDDNSGEVYRVGSSFYISDAHTLTPDTKLETSSETAKLKDASFNVALSGDSIVREEWFQDDTDWTHEYAIYDVNFTDGNAKEDADGNVIKDDDGNTLYYSTLDGSQNTPYVLDINVDSVKSNVSDLIYYNNTIAGQWGDDTDVKSPYNAEDAKHVIAREIGNTNADITGVDIFVLGTNPDGTVINGKARLDVDLEGVVVDQKGFSYKFANGDNPKYTIEDFTKLVAGAPANNATSAKAASKAASSNAAAAAASATSDAPQTGVNAPVAAASVGVLALAATVLSKKRKND